MIRWIFQFSTVAFKIDLFRRFEALWTLKSKYTLFGWVHRCKTHTKSSTPQYTSFTHLWRKLWIFENEWVRWIRASTPFRDPPSSNQDTHCFYKLILSESIKPLLTFDHTHHYTKKSSTMSTTPLHCLFWITEPYILWMQVRKTEDWNSIF